MKAFRDSSTTDYSQARRVHSGFNYLLLFTLADNFLGLRASDSKPADDAGNPLWDLARITESRAADYLLLTSSRVSCRMCGRDIALRSNEPESTRRT